MRARNRARPRSVLLLKKILAALILPPFGPLLLAAFGLAVLRRRPRLGRTLAWTGLVLATLLALPASVDLLLIPLERYPVFDPAGARDSQAIVILAGGKRRDAPEYRGDTVNGLSLERLRYGARLARQTGLPVLVSGGAPTPGVPEALLMREVLEHEFGVPVRWTESASRDTRENAVFSAQILRQAGVSRVVLVTHAAHMRRALAEFAAAGIEAVPAPTAFLHGSGGGTLASHFPSASAAYAGWLATHEWLGNLARSLR
jgi:uncharacterized SAM-binding protein YcdF (DUF218 family)